MAGWSTATGRALVRFQAAALKLTAPTGLGNQFPVASASRTFMGVASSENEPSVDLPVDAEFVR
jgi:hypothetical protein